ncbi:22024_t:CDS:2 [Racocetra persica]|uniref:22024_t:CDS:1 n=1 Tax=Racocetra persica TaxID=160502 RepID=A0ACA9MRC8_9GLOM|nr:22024_t:CDS:2 [Racocetra persica]
MIDLSSFPEYNGSCHPEDWLREFLFVATVQENKLSESEIISLALLKISRSIYRNNNSIKNISQLLKFLKADPSFSIFKMESERKIMALHFTYSTDVTHFIIELRQLLADAEICDFKLQKQSILKILPTKFLDTYRLKIVDSHNIEDVFINLQNFLSNYKRVVKYGSVITLRHFGTEKLLSSSLHRYTGGTKQYWAYAVDYRATGPTDHELWTIMPEVIKDGISPTYNPVNNGNKMKGSVVCNGDKITLLNNGTGQKLHSHKLTEEFKVRKSPVTSQQEVTCQTWNNSDDNWVVQHDIHNITSEDQEPWNECHNIVLMHVKSNLGLNSHPYMLNNDYQEVTCFGDKANTSKWRVEILNDLFQKP